ncbi:MAG: DUF2179 domain-containing protein, partial [Clostridia bacterium]|nr:DUF2179 domain-containing protein [Clostridia bacterium]
NRNQAQKNDAIATRYDPLVPINLHQIPLFPSFHKPGPPRFELQKLKTIIKETDPKAFTIIGEVSEVLGEGFKEEKPND